MAWVPATLMISTLLAAALGPSTAFVVVPPASSTGRPPAIDRKSSASVLPAAPALMRRDDFRKTSRGGTAMAAAARIVTGEELEVEMTEWDAPMILDVFATWCGPCVQLKPEVEKVSEALEGKCRVLKLDSDEEEAMAGALNIYGLPTVIYMKDGEEKHRTEGFMPAEEILQLADIHLFGKTPPEVADPADALFIDEDVEPEADDTPACPTAPPSACEP